jgi:hypothetical protein
MWLLDTTTLKLKEFIGRSIPSYVILSHTWGLTEDEVSFSDMRKHRDIAETKIGFSKIKNCCLKAVQDGLQYAWVDSCCIDKRSSAELSEAINSMYKYYAESTVCYAYLADVPSSTEGQTATVSDQDFTNSRWFTRGWTLQELLAPSIVCFFASDWTFIAAKQSIRGSDSMKTETKLFLEQLAVITKIPKDVLEDPKAVHNYSSAQKMSWASWRQTTRVEDTAYSLMGLCDIHMLILYGEGETKAFHRLQLEIIQKIPDQSIFAWRRKSDEPSDSGLLANSPRDFREASGIVILQNGHARFQSYSMTNLGLQISLAIQNDKLPSEQESSFCQFQPVTGFLQCWEPRTYNVVAIRLKPMHIGLQDRRVVYRRTACDTFEPRNLLDIHRGKITELHVLEDAQMKYMDQTRNPEYEDNLDEVWLSD